MKFFYTAKSFSGETKTGELEVKNERDLAEQLRSEGFVLISSKQLDLDQKKAARVRFLDKFFGVPLKEKLVFAKNLSVMISSGLTLSRSVENLGAQVKSRRFKEILAQIREDLQSGNSFADGLAKFPAVFSDLFVNMVKVGESSGNLEEVLNILANQLEKEHELKSKVRGALMYPTVILLAMVGIGIIMLTFVLPKITGVFTDMKVELPPTTQFIIAVSNFMRDHSYLTIGSVVFLAVFLKFFLTTKSGKKTLAFVSLRVPVINDLVKKINCARFSRFYSSLLRSGVSVVETLRIISETLTNYSYQRVIKESVEQVQKGIPLSEIIRKHEGIFLIQVWQMMQVGEETGKTEAVMMKLAEFYEEEINQTTKNLSSIIEPFLMIIIGGAVGFFAVAMLQPIYGLMENIN
ncbi:MAG: type II secretion system F family protein [Patescibacteria group bacterium]